MKFPNEFAKSSSYNVYDVLKVAVNNFRVWLNSEVKKCDVNKAYARNR